MKLPKGMRLKQYVRHLERQNEAMAHALHKLNSECQVIILKKENEFMNRCGECEWNPNRNQG